MWHNQRWCSPSHSLTVLLIRVESAQLVPEGTTIVQTQISSNSAASRFQDHGDIDFSVVTAVHQGMTILSVAGDIDLLTAPRLREAVTAALVSESRCLIIDLTQTKFLSSSGMRVLIDAHNAISPTGHLGIVADGPATSRPMKLIGLDQILTIMPTLDAAASAFGGSRAMTRSH